MIPDSVSIFAPHTSLYITDVWGAASFFHASLRSVKTFWLAKRLQPRDHVQHYDKTLRQDSKIACIWPMQGPHGIA